MAHYSWHCTNSPVRLAVHVAVTPKQDPEIPRKNSFVWSKQLIPIPEGAICHFLVENCSFHPCCFILCCPNHLWMSWSNEATRGNFCGPTHWKHAWVLYGYLVILLEEVDSFQAGFFSIVHHHAELNKGRFDRSGWIPASVTLVSQK